MSNKKTVEFGPHDKFFREVFSDNLLTKELLIYCLPQEFVDCVDLTCLKLLRRSFFPKALGGRELIVDLLLETRLQQSQVPAYILLEHKSYPDRFTALQVSIYRDCVHWHYHKQHPTKKLPYIFTAVLHHGKKPFPYRPDMRDLLAAPLKLTEPYVVQPFHLIDLAQIEDAKIKGSPVLKVVLLVMKHIHDDHLMNYLELNISSLLIGLGQQYPHLLLSLLYYLLRAGNIGSERDFFNFVDKTFQNLPKIRGDIMSLEEKIEKRGEKIGWEKGHAKGREEGREEGRVEGHVKGKKEGLLEGVIENAKRMLKLGFPEDTVLKVTRLSRKKLTSLKKAAV